MPQRTQILATQFAAVICENPRNLCPKDKSVLCHVAQASYKLALRGLKIVNVENMSASRFGENGRDAQTDSQFIGIWRLDAMHERGIRAVEMNEREHKLTRRGKCAECSVRSNLNPFSHFGKTTRAKRARGDEHALT